MLLNLRPVATWFERISIMVILLNCVTLGMYQPCENIDCTSDRCQILQVSPTPLSLPWCVCVCVCLSDVMMKSQNKNTEGHYSCVTWLDTLASTSFNISFCKLNKTLFKCSSLNVVAPLHLDPPIVSLAFRQVPLSQEASTCSPHEGFSCVCTWTGRSQLHFGSSSQPWK